MEVQLPIKHAASLHTAVPRVGLCPWHFGWWKCTCWWKYYRVQETEMQSFYTLALCISVGTPS